ncbi:transcription factor S-II, central domain-containing protein [Thamnocephalis sphaerospora]|uniref:Transcription factor S-II, central domain-containing protein n=1 Tax=Thamnocephalis sphaerospora TaxID=78915 RepID=A0A4P9XKX6_9FUNG|nr:transcription factor S-II, central domain-containing protein [Thamnocephalis sphaerospora]|eukprot:RKP06484.1 transcription factor S-II, central domain-containing protein [Thamnocephalis sphaerospora]
MPQSNSADDTIRHRCTHMLANALRGDDERHASAQDEHLMQIASEAEAALYARYRDKASTEYKTAVRSRLWNLRNSENPMLRERLLNGLLSPQQFANMTDESSVVFVARVHAALLASIRWCP